jgi:hypothetical protein
MRLSRQQVGDSMYRPAASASLFALSIKSDLGAPLAFAVYGVIGAATVLAIYRVDEGGGWRDLETVAQSPVP